MQQEDLFHKLASTKKHLLSRITRLRQEVDDLHQKIASLQQEKADLELLLEMNTKHSDSIEEDLLNKVESTLRESERRFRLISETIPVPITVSRVSDHTIVYANEPASCLFGLPIEMLYGCKTLDFYDPASRLPLLQPLAVDEYVNNYELQGKKINGTPFYGALYSRPLTFNNEPCLLCVVYDMTERKRAEDEVRTLNEELEERVKKRTQQLEEAHAKIVKLEKEALEIQMAGGFAHEMRNALVGAKLMLASVTDSGVTLCQKNAEILGELYDLIARYMPDEQQDDILDCLGRLEQHEGALDNVFHMVDQSINSALEVTTLTLEYSKLGRATAGDEIVDLRMVIEQIIQEHAANFAEDRITIRLQLSADTPLLGYESHFYSIINNLVLNARDELIEVEDDRARFIEVTLHQEAQTLILTVTDNADGIPEETLPKIFEPFFSTKPTTGTGLGLSFVSKLVPMYSGTIAVTSEVNKGTTFTLTFPIQDRR
jgi:PAS domain S-box-containing protein